MITRTASNRVLHLIDVENLAGGSFCSLQGVETTADEYLSLILPTGEDIYVIATSCNNAPAACFGWPTSAQRLMRSGENGADLALLNAYEPLEITSKFSRVVIGSGDGIFAELAIQLTTLGCEVTIVSRPDALSKRLQMAANNIVLLSDIHAENGSNYAA